MCGIVGVAVRVAEQTSIQLWLTGMNLSQIHRGPDAEGTFVDAEAGIGLAMRRLSIIDLSGGLQPMRSRDGRYTLVFNGEIVNAPALRVELEKDGVVFRSAHSDTEVLLALLERWGVDALPQLNGMFAFALHDAQQGTLTLARDRFGIKPLYYIEEGGRFAFASEMKSLLRLPFVRREVDHSSLFHYLSLMYVPGEKAILSGVRRLLPGHLLVYRLRDSSLSRRQWWKPGFEPDFGVAEREWPAMIREGFQKAVARWALSDVPIACSLSGGLDSSAIVGALSLAGQCPSTFSLGFSGAGEAQWNELPLAAAVARKWGTEHHEQVMAPADLLDDLGGMVWHMDEPYGGGLPSWAVFKLMSRSVKVGLVGSGGDELFGNYGKWLGLEGRFPGFGRGVIGFEKFSRNFFDRYYYFPDALKRDVLLEGGGLEDTAALLFRHFSARTGSVRDRVAVTDMETQLTDEFLTMTDRFSMAHSLEARPPFLDNELVDLVRQIPARYRTSRHDLKGLLRSAVSPLLPAELLGVPKKGFVIPLKLWLRNALRPVVERVLSPERLARQGIFSPELYRLHVLPHLDGRQDLTTRVWGLLMFQLWYNQFIENPARSHPTSIRELMDSV